jgi:hypothetical protein
MAGPHEAEALITAQQHRSTHRPGRSAMSERQGSTTTLEGSRYRGRRRRRPSPHLGLRVRSNGFASGSACNARPPPSSGVSERECVTVCVRAGFLLFLSGSRCDQCSIGSFHERHCAALWPLYWHVGRNRMARRSVLDKESQRFVLEVWFCSFFNRAKALLPSFRVFPRQTPRWESRKVKRDVILDLVSEHPSALITTYDWKQIKHLKHVSEILAKHLKNNWNYCKHTQHSDKTLTSYATSK